QPGRYVTKKSKQTQQGGNRQSYQSASKVNKAKKGSPQIAAQNAQASRNAAAYANKTKQRNANTVSRTAFQSNKKYKAQHFNLASNTRQTRFNSVTYMQSRRSSEHQYW